MKKFRPISLEWLRELSREFVSFHSLWVSWLFLMSVNPARKEERTLLPLPLPSFSLSLSFFFLFLFEAWKSDLLHLPSPSTAHVPLLHFHRPPLQLSSTSVVATATPFLLTQQIHSFPSLVPLDLYKWYTLFAYGDRRSKCGVHRAYFAEYLSHRIPRQYSSSLIQSLQVLLVKVYLDYHKIKDWMMIWFKNLMKLNHLKLRNFIRIIFHI
jgi:hypothetical protein